MARTGVDLRAGEDGSATRLFLYCFLLFASFYAAKSVRQATFVDGLGADRLPWVYLLVALSALPTLVVYGRLAERFDLNRLAVLSTTGVAASLVIFWWLWAEPKRWLPAVFYLWITPAFSVLISQFWSVASHAFDPRQAKRLFGFIAAGGALGGVAGGQIARFGVGTVGARDTLLVLAALALAIGPLARIAPGSSPLRAGTAADAQAAPGRIGRALGGFAAVRGSRHLQLVAGMMLLTVMVAQVVDLQFNWAVERATTDLGDRAQAFGNFYSLIGLGAFFFQLLLTGRLQRALGIGTAMRVLPVTVAVGTALLLGAAMWLPAAVLFVAWGLKLTDGGLRHSLDQVTRELLFLPVRSEERVQAKAFIDVFVQRFAKGVAALLLLTVTYGLIDPLQSSWLTFVLVGAWIMVTVAVRRSYVRSYRDGLVMGSMAGGVEIDFSDGATVERLVETLSSPDPRQVLHALELIETHGRSRLVTPLLLYHAEAAVRLRTLELLARAGRSDAAAHVERCFDDDDPDVCAEAARTLAALRGRKAAETLLPRLDSSDPRMRAAAIAAIARSSSDPSSAGRGLEHAKRALDEMLSDEDPRVRIEAARAIGAVPEPLFQEQLVQLLYAGERDVVRAAIGAARRRLGEAFNPLYVPILISLMRDRRLKHDCRQALVAAGPSVIPALTHFMNDPQEQIWVRRAAPKTIAAIGGRTAIAALIEGLGASDAFVRRKVIEALAAEAAQGSLPVEDDERARAIVRRAVRREAQEYAQLMADLLSLEKGVDRRLPAGRAAARCIADGPVVRWPAPPPLLEQLLGGRLRHRVEHLFGLLSVLYPDREIRAVHRCLDTGGRAGVRYSSSWGHALEYLDNTLTGEVHHQVLTVLGDDPPEEKLRRCRRLFDVAAGTPAETLERLLAEAPDDDADRSFVTVAALHAVGERRETRLYPRVTELARDAADELVRETAAWVAARLGLEIGEPPPARMEAAR